MGSPLTPVPALPFHANTTLLAFVKMSLPCTPRVCGHAHEGSATPALTSHGDISVNTHRECPVHGDAGGFFQRRPLRLRLRANVQQHRSGTQQAKLGKGLRR